MSKSLGNKKPELIVQIERALWRALLDIATGRQGTFSAVQNFISNVPWDDLDMVDTQVAEFFVDGEPLAIGI